MSKKDNLSTTVIKSDTIDSDGAKYQYSLHATKSPRVASYRLPLYSITVKMTDCEGNITDATLGDIFSDVGKAIVFYDRLVANLATPIDLPYILEDEIS
jgi:hypothetical protein